MSAIGHMVCLWTWALDNAPEGDLTGMSAAVIAAGAEWNGCPETFIEVLVKVGFLDQTPDTLQIHDWDDYAGKLIDRRKADRERKRVRRMSAGIPQDVRRNSSATVPYRTLPYTEIEYIATLRSIPGWTERGEPHIETLVKWAKTKGHSPAVLEGSAIGLGKVQTKTLNGYSNLVRAFQDRVNKGYDDPARIERSTDGTKPRAGARFANDHDKYVEAAKSDIG